VIVVTHENPFRGLWCCSGSMARSDTSPLRRTFPVPGGPAVRLRMAGPSDRAAVHALLGRRDVDASELDVRRLLSFDPARRHVLCAFAPLEGHDTLVGLGAIDVGGDAPDVLVVDERLARGLGEVLGRVLTERARRRRAA
jgi:hypothetical protein